MRFALYYIRWHYSQGIVDLIGVVRNFIWFFYTFFSIPLLLKTLFQPFERLGERYSKGFDPGAWAQVFVVNSLMRVVGALLRLFLVLIGIIFIILTIVVGVLFLVAWILAPLLLFFLVTYGLKLMSLGH
ncbi:MAG: hypothetical protein UV60_C0005G0006 [Parcubacteria group bacterium GW2011_GWA2_43_11]|nr:MAG: hypothetical protein UU89_C0004G0005 [Parcubacteria group bacterium GW2011_GWC2_42_11]KKS85816.1 MAG: hypothetical protein UV60_C0005G0006 [Parcubacteria group bacterium GW2011_GWA2_43_11]